MKTVAMIALLAAASACGAGLLFEGSKGTAECDGNIAPITSGYGANGSYHSDVETFRNPLSWRSEVSVFLPRELSKAPVIFFAHGFGATSWSKVYSEFIPHMASLGYVVVYSSYPTISADIQQRYDILWKGFELAVEKYRSRMDLTQIGFVGHSFGGGAIPAMAYKGMVQNGWGSKASFMFMLAPWYSYDISSAQMGQLPSHTVQVMEIYDKDDVNDHRMAIDLYRSIKLPSENKFFLSVRSVNINGCEVIADHSTPARNPSLRQKQYAVFRPFDALADYVFNGNQAGREALMGKGATATGAANYKPLSLVRNPEPQVPQSNFRFPWDNMKENERLSLEKW